MDNLETNKIVEFIKHINNDDFSNAEKAIKSVVEEKIKNKMKKHMEDKSEKAEKTKKHSKYGKKG